jgi:hypothetical protein
MTKDKDDDDEHLVFRRGRNGLNAIVFLHKKVDGCQAATQMLAALNDLKSKGVFEEFVGIITVIDEVDDRVVRDNIRGLFENLVVVI